MNLEIIWNIVNSPIGWAISGFIILFVINKIFAAKPGWAKYEGPIISAIKWAEKSIDDNTDNAGMKKADAALKFFIKSYTEAKGKKPSTKIIEKVQLGMPIVHDKIEHMMQRFEQVKHQMKKEKAA